MRLKIILVLFLVTANIAISQNQELKWQLNTGMNVLIYRHPIDIQQDMLDFNNANVGFPLSQISLSRHLFAGFSPEIILGTAQVTQYPATDLSKNLLVNGLFNLKYSFANGYLISKTSFFEPFFKGGIGQTYKDNVGNKFFTTFDFGGGIAFWLTKNKNFGIQLQQIYCAVPSVKYNNEDYFNYSANLSYRFGLKDRDKDGVADDKDACPDQAGLKCFQGCPDTDKDGIADKDDRCPEDAGLAEFRGCPDTDGDSIPDIDDKCPEIKGQLSAQGCPDKDGDGIQDKEDRCPEIKGLAIFAGCPDKDKDSVPDIDDKCPDVPGLVSMQGCPDSDLDSVPDHIDKCPNEKGTIANNGCPDTAVEMERKSIENQISFHAKSIFFETGKHKILSKSFPMLNEIAKIISSSNPTEVFVVEGHADVTGGEKFNLELSRNRANAVKEYLIKQGVSGNKLESEGYGIKFPISDNNSGPGRAKNRRVDITIKR